MRVCRGQRIFWGLINLIKSFMQKSLITLGSLVVIIVVMAKYKICPDGVSPKVFKDVCESYSNGEMVGSICEDMCQINETNSFACSTIVTEQTLPPGLLSNTSVLIRKAPEIGGRMKLHFRDEDGNKVYPSQVDLAEFIKIIVKRRYNVDIDSTFARKISMYDYTNNLSEKTKYTALEYNWQVIQSNEYLASIVFEKYKIFPRLVGTCGNLYVFEHYNSIAAFWHLITLYDSKESWLKRVKLAIRILDYVKKLETVAPEPLYLCDIDTSHFGVSDDGKRVVYTNLHTVFPYSVASGVTGMGNRCSKHSDCDFKNCRSVCDFISGLCLREVSNNNLQLVCEKVFLGYEMSGGVSLPGLLTGPNAPHELLKLIQLCADPANDLDYGRAAATPEIRDKLYKFLVQLTY